MTNGIASPSVEINHPPVTTASLAGTAGQDGWYLSDVQVTLTAADPDGADDIAFTKYAVDGGPLQTYTAPFTVSGDGIHNVTFYSEDQGGNQDVPTKSATIRIDTTAPGLSGSASITSLWPPNQTMTPDVISGSFGDEGSGIDPSSVIFRVIDEYGLVQPTGPVTIGEDGSFSFTVMLEASRRGADLDGRLYQIIVSGRDLAGNVASVTIQVIVPHDQGGS